MDISDTAAPGLFEDRCGPIRNLEPSAEPLLGDLIAGGLANSAVVLCESLDDIVRDHPDDDPEAVHQARVAIRRIRSPLREMRDLLPARSTAQLQSDLAAFARALGEVRDLDVLADRLEQIHSQGTLDQVIDRPAPKAKPKSKSKSKSATDASERLESGMLELRGLVAAETVAARERLMADLNHPGAGKLVDRLVDYIARLPKRKRLRIAPASPILASVSGANSRLTKAVEQLSTPATNAELHRIRILTKRTRYNAELFAPISGSAGRSPQRFAARLGTLQDELGILTDANTLTIRLLTMNQLLSADGGSAAGLVAGHLGADANRDRQRWQGAWERSQTKSTSNWLR